MLSNILALAPAAAVDPNVTEETAGGLVGLLHHLAASPTGLQLLWFALVAVLWTGYLVLEGFDFGVGMLLPFVGKKDNERRALLSTIGPLWDGNEVWVLTAGGATFAAFPEWYATLFSAAYLPLFLILVGLIIRAVAFEYRGKINSDTWRKVWDWCIILGSWIPAILWGVAFANLVAGVKAYVDPTQLGSTKILYAGTFFDLVFAHGGFLLLGGLVTASLFLAHGAIFLSLKTDGIVRQRAESLAPKLSIAATVLSAVWVVWLGLKFAGLNHPTLLIWIGIAVAAVALIVVVLTTLGKRFGLAFTSMTVALLAAVVTIFAALFPNVINGSNVKLKGDAVADPIVGAVVLGVANSEATYGVDMSDGVNLEDVVNITFDRVAAGGLPSTPAQEGAEAERVTHDILESVAVGDYPIFGFLPQERIEQAVVATVGRVGANGGIPDTSVASDWAKGWSEALTPAILENVRDGAFPAIGVIPAAGVEAVVSATFARVGAAAAAGAVDLTQVGVGVEASDLAKDLTVGVLQDVATGTFPAAQVIPDADVKTVVDITFARVGALAAAGAVDIATVGTDVADDQISDLAVQLTVGILADVAQGEFPAAKVISTENVLTAVAITLARLGIEPTEATLVAVVEGVQANKDAILQLQAGAIGLDDLAAATIAGLPANAVATEVARTVQALVPHLQITVEALVPHIQGSVDVVVEEIKKSVDQIVNVEVVATLQAVADDTNTATFAADTDVTAIVNGTAWENSDGLANLNGRIKAANEALDALVTLGLLESHTPLAEFDPGATISGQPINASASSELTLKLMTWVAVCLVPIVLAYQAWSIYVFRRRISADRIPAESGL
ncbi:MAG: cytochrome d ubiquinol oxidase subunit II [Bifidobacteriaceae bacterium]|jgi:cytochrome d ubiquinol oxidase subunit II|nr:cytochrome d ubiquinol oxidase subunit II [Bifidobacteriaceae bacterium]